MHYIRFLKLPALSLERTGVHLHAKITITTDLGESFLCLDLPILLILIDQTGRKVQVYPCRWKAGKRELEISFSFPLTTIQLWPCRVIVQPRDADCRLDMLVDNFSPTIKDKHVGVILPVMSGHLVAKAVIHHGPEQSLIHNSLDSDDQSSELSTRVSPKRVARQIKMTDRDMFFIWEDTGESIARHIWDAGLLLSAYIDSSRASSDNLGLAYPERLKVLFQKEKLDVLELGTGCGIVGITFARCFPKAEVLITDTPAAEEIARHNISMIGKQACPNGSFAKIQYQNLDWEDSLPGSLKNGNLDLILVADCTYNPDVVPDLVKTLADLVKQYQKVLILVAMKIRHYSEMVFFELMAEKKMIAVDKVVLPMPVLGQQPEEIELHFFKGS